MRHFFPIINMACHLKVTPNSGVHNKHLLAWSTLQELQCPVADKPFCKFNNQCHCVAFHMLYITSGSTSLQLRFKVFEWGKKSAAILSCNATRAHTCNPHAWLILLACPLGWLLVLLLLNSTASSLSPTQSLCARLLLLCVGFFFFFEQEAHSVDSVCVAWGHFSRERDRESARSKLGQKATESWRYESNFNSLRGFEPRCVWCD